MKTTTVRFIGATCSIGDINLRYFGQKVEIPEDVYRNAVKGNAALLPEADFRAIGFTDQELVRYRTPGARQNPSDAFARRYSQACAKLRENREELLNPKPIETKPLRVERPKDKS